MGSDAGSETDALAERPRPLLGASVGTTTGVDTGGGNCALGCDEAEASSGIDVKGAKGGMMGFGAGGVSDSGGPSSEVAST